MEVAKSNRRHNINSAPFRKVYADNRAAYFTALNDIIADLRIGVSANPPTASDDQLQEAVSRSATDEALFPDIPVSDISTDAPSVVDPIIPPQLALHTVGGAPSKELFDTKAIGLATIPEFSKDNVQKFVDAVDQHQALRCWTDGNAATAAPPLASSMAPVNCILKASSAKSRRSSSPGSCFAGASSPHSDQRSTSLNAAAPSKMPWLPRNGLCLNTTIYWFRTSLPTSGTTLG